MEPFSCEICSKTFKDNWRLQRHQLIHTGEKPFSCENCGKKFTQRNILTRHLLVHSGEKQYFCQMCPKNFTHKHNLKAHFDIHHTKNGPLENMQASKIKTEVNDNKINTVKSSENNFGLKKTVEVYDFEDFDQFSIKKETQGVEIGELKYTQSVKSFFCEICSKLYAFKSYLEKPQLIQQHNDTVHAAAML